MSVTFFPCLFIFYGAFDLLPILQSFYTLTFADLRLTAIKDKVRYFFNKNVTLVQSNSSLSLRPLQPCSKILYRSGVVLGWSACRMAGGAITDRITLISVAIRNGSFSSFIRGKHSLHNKVINKNLQRRRVQRPQVKPAGALRVKDSFSAQLRSTRKYLLIVIILFLFLIILGGVVFFFYNYEVIIQQISNLKMEQGIVSKEFVKTINDIYLDPLFDNINLLQNRDFEVLESKPKININISFNNTFSLFPNFN